MIVIRPMNWVGPLCLVLAGWLIAVAAPGAARGDVASAAAKSTAQDRKDGAVHDGSLHLSEFDRETYAKAFRLAADGRFDEARSLAAAGHEPILDKVLLWLDLAEPRDEGSFAMIATFVAKNPRWPGQGALRLHAEMVMPPDLSDAEVLAWFGSHEPLSAQGAIRLAAALQHAGQSDRALQVVRDAWATQIMSDADEAEFLGRYRALIRPEDNLARLERLLWNRQERAARRLAHHLGRKYTALAEARLRLARNRPGVDAAIRRVPAALQTDSGLIYERALWRQRRGRYADVIELLDPPDPTAANPQRWWPLRHWAARQALWRGDISVAYRIAAGHGMTSGLGFAEAEWLAGWIALRFLDQPRAAYDHFIRLYRGVSSPVSLARGAFWSGEAARALHRNSPGENWATAASNWYEIAAAHDTTFYGQLAGRRLGQDPTVDLTPGSTPGEEARAAFDSDELVHVVRKLGEIGELDLQQRFLGWLQALAKTAEDFALTAELADSVGRPDMAMRTARAARSDGIILPRHLFPTMDIPKVEPLEEALLQALIRQESGFYTNAVSPAGARGLMQIMPGTARQVARRIEASYDHDRLLSDPDYNMRLGSAYLGELLDQYDGSYVLTLAAYNAGPRRVAEWIAAFGDPRDPKVDVVDWIESIPLDETRNYVQRILESLVAYRQQLVGTPSLAAGLLDVNPIDEILKPSALDSDVSCCL